MMVAAGEGGDTADEQLANGSPSFTGLALLVEEVNAERRAMECR